MSRIKVNHIVNQAGDGATQGNLIGNLTGDVTGNVTGNLSGDITGALDSTFTRNVGVCTNSVQTQQLTGVGNSFFGMYIGDGFLAFNPTLANPNGYYISTSINALNAGPVSLASTMQLDGVWVIV